VPASGLKTASIGPQATPLNDPGDPVTIATPAAQNACWTLVSIATSSPKLICCALA
jgi:hypothetical protein